jgi:uncharacterized protein YqfA (UPF0365 family)
MVLAFNVNFTSVYTLLFLIIGFFVCIFLSIISKFVKLWFQAFVTGTPISLFNIIGMSLRKISPRLIVNARINAFKAGLKDITVSDLETHFLAGGHVNDVVRAMIAADKANIALNWKQATAIDLAGRNLFEAVRTSVNPKVIDCPPNGEFISAVAKDGIELKCKARVTVRTNIQRLVGGATEETIIARVGEGIVSTIGASKNHQIVLESPQKISKLVLDKGLDAATAYEILSIDIADITIGDNVGARLEVERAEADVRVARAKAEERKAMAIALEHENIAKIKEAESMLPISMAKAFESGNLGILDYFKLKNIQADTSMRDFIAKSTTKKEDYAKRIRK